MERGHAVAGNAAATLRSPLALARPDPRHRKRTPSKDAIATADRLLGSAIQLQSLRKIVAWRVEPRERRGRVFDVHLCQWARVCAALPGSDRVAWTKTALDWLTPLHCALGLERPLLGYLVAAQREFAKSAAAGPLRSQDTLRPLWAWLAITVIPGLVVDLAGLHVYNREQWLAELATVLARYPWLGRRQASIQETVASPGFSSWVCVELGSALVLATPATSLAWPSDVDSSHSE